MAQDQILDAAVEEVIDYGVKKFSVERVAQRVGMSRTGIYRYFASKDALIHAVVASEVERVFRRITPTIDRQSNIEDQLVEGFAAVVSAARGSRLIKRTFTAEPDVAMKFLTQSRQVLDIAHAYVASRLEGQMKPDDARAVAEVIVRVGLTFVVLQDGTIKLSSAEEARAFARRFLVPMLS